MRFSLSLLAPLISIGFAFTASSQTSNISPSFNCSANLTQIEQAICDNNNLATLDNRLSKLYKTARKDGDESDQIQTKTDQRAWLKKRNASCSNFADDNQRMVECVELHYLRRTIDLQDQTSNTSITSKTPNPISDNPVTNDTDGKTSQDRQANIKTLRKQLLREGYTALDVGFSSIDTQQVQKVAQNALETAVACAQRLNNDLRTKRKICYNYDQDISPIGIEFSNGDKLCASVEVKGQGGSKTLVTTDSLRGSVTYENNTVAIVYPTRGSSREFFYNFNRDKGYSILGDVMRTEFSQCGDFE